MLDPLLRSPRRSPRRVGHKGAAHIEPGNTLASFHAALRHGVDMIELDVLSERADGSGRLLVAHDYQDMRSRTPLSFERALEHLAGDDFAGLEFDVDIKLPGYEIRVLQLLRTNGLVPRTLLSGMFKDSLARIRAAEPALRLGWSVPRVRRDYTTDMLTAIPALAVNASARNSPFCCCSMGRSLISTPITPSARIAIDSHFAARATLGRRSSEIITIIASSSGLIGRML